MSTNLYRKEPKAGEVITVKVGDEAWCYLAITGYNKGWMMDFYTNKPTKNSKYFPKSSFKVPLFFSGRFSRRYYTATTLKFSEEDQLPPVVYKLDEVSQRHLEAPTPYQVTYPFGSRKYVTKEEASKLFAKVDLKIDSGEVEEYLKGMLPKLRRIEIPPEHQWMPPENIDPKPNFGPIVVEVHFQCPPGAMGLEADEIADEIGDDLFVNGLGELMTMDSAGEDSEFEIILEVEAHRIKGAISQIRKTLKRLKAPASTRIFEVADTGTVEHPLVAPPKQK